jgi:branched-chain amino acid transport system substrate-binding protein
MKRSVALFVVVLFAAAAGSAPAAVPTIYSSLPLHGDSRPQSLSMERAERLALAEHGGQAGGRRIRYVARDDSTAAAGKWDPGKVSLNARRAAQDASTIAYLGEFNSGGSAISIPILNEAGILTVSPSNTAVGLTRAEGGDKGEPDKYYPSGRRTYGRTVPADHLQADALVRWMTQLGVRRPYLLDDGEVYGRGMADMVAARAAAAGMAVAGRSRFGTHRPARTLAGRVATARPDAVVVLGITQNGAAGVVNAVGRRLRSVPVFGDDGVAEAAFTRHVARSVRARVHLTDPSVPDAARGAAAVAFASRYRARYHTTPEPYAIFAYEAMAVTLDAIDRAAAQGAATRDGVVAAFFATHDRDSVLGRYSIDPSGDTTLAAYGGYAISPHGAPRFDRLLAPA